MIFTFITICPLILFFLLCDKEDIIDSIMPFLFIWLFVVTITGAVVVKNINLANEIKAKIILMKPLGNYRQDIAITEKELAKAYGDEYYQLQQKYAVYSNSIFDGWIVRLFSMNEDYKPISNQNYYPN